MTTVRRSGGLPVLALVLGVVGAVLLGLGVLGLYAPHSAGFAPLLREPPVASALVASGAMFLAVEAVMVLAWARQRRANR